MPDGSAPEHRHEARVATRTTDYSAATGESDDTSVPDEPPPDDDRSDYDAFYDVPFTEPELPFSLSASPPSRTNPLSPDVDTMDPHDAPPHLDSTRSSSGRGNGGITDAVRMMKARMPEGLTNNYSEWVKAVKAVSSTLDKDMYRMIKGKATEPDPITADEDDVDAFELASDRLHLFFEEILGARATIIDGIPGHAVLGYLEERYGSAVTTSERTKDFLDLVSLKYEEGGDFVLHYETFKDIVSRINVKVRAARIANKHRYHLIPAIPDDLARDFFVMTLDATLKNDVFTILTDVLEIDTLFSKLLALVNNRSVAASSEVAFAARSTPARPPRPPPRSSSRTPATPGRVPTVSAPFVPRTPVAQRSRNPGTPSASTLRYSSAIDVPGVKRWPHGTFRRADGTYRFKAPRDVCYKCWGRSPDGSQHYARDCTVDASVATANKTRLLGQEGIILREPEAAALVSQGWEEIRAAQYCGVSDFGNAPNAYFSGGDAQAFFAYPDGPVGALCVEWDDVPDDRYDAEDPLAAVAVVDVPFVPTSARGFVALVLPDAEGDAPVATALNAAVIPSPAAVALPVQVKRDFLFDTGASVHLTCDRSLLTEYRMLEASEKIRVAGAFGSGGAAEGIGALVGEFDVDGKKFERVYYVPSLGHNLISGFQLLAAGFSISTRDRALEVRSPGPANMLVARLSLDMRSGCIPVKMRPIGTNASAISARRG
ncbi:hypothetical protein Rhopal_005234-T1 [Rhodotorula paludigena]|uniref:Retrovirus-related Pol polyprotein from transposon TNT 1-94-like beta-barrel domain-containing protein n=1 Tax=Rhodotorula paludigena TaxID=86838 RepID=A0AAV5GQL5_9BASI|nr:hypothetical protein Rhopal_005234-T1 [Rhodotorula paludigena]